MGGVGDVQLATGVVDGDSGRALDRGIGNEPQLLALPVKHADALLALLDDVNVFLRVERQLHWRREGLFTTANLAGGLLGEVIDKYRGLRVIRDIHPVAIVRDGDAHRFDDAVGARCFALEELQEGLGAGGFLAQIVVADDGADIFDPRHFGRLGPHHVDFLRCRRGGAAGYQDQQPRRDSPEDSPRGKPERQSNICVHGCSCSEDAGSCGGVPTRVDSGRLLVKCSLINVGLSLRRDFDVAQWFRPFPG